MLFSQRYKRVLEQKKLDVEIDAAARKKIWSWLCANNSHLGVQRNPNDNWISETSAIEEAGIKMLVEQGWDNFPGIGKDQFGNADFIEGMKSLFLSEEAPLVFDAIELIAKEMNSPERDLLPKKINEIFELHDCPWRSSDGEFFKLDADFMGARLAVFAHDALAANHFVGAVDEYAKARHCLGTRDSKDAIFYAGHSFESVMKVMTGLEQANADKLIKELNSQGFFDDLPEAVRGGFTDQVLKSLPFLRNKLGGHGQGASIVTVPQPYAELAVQLAAALHNFLIAKYLARQPIHEEPLTSSVLFIDDDIPF